MIDVLTRLLNVGDSESKDRTLYTYLWMEYGMPITLQFTLVPMGHGSWIILELSTIDNNNVLGFGLRRYFEINR